MHARKVDGIDVLQELAVFIIMIWKMFVKILFIQLRKVLVLRITFVNDAILENIFIILKLHQIELLN